MPKIISNNSFNLFLLKELPRELFYYTTQKSDLDQILKTGYISPDFGFKYLAMLSERNLLSDYEDKCDYENDSSGICYIAFKTNELPVRCLERLLDGRHRWVFPCAVSIYSVPFAFGKACKRIPKKSPYHPSSKIVAILQHL